MATFQVLGYAIGASGLLRHVTQEELLGSHVGTVEARGTTPPLIYATVDYTIIDTGDFFISFGVNTTSHMQFWNAEGHSTRIEGRIGSTITAAITDVSVFVQEQWSQHVQTGVVYQGRWAQSAATVFSGNDIVTGNSGNDLLLGFDGEDTITGGAGDDIIDGGGGNDQMIGGAGNDCYVVDGSLFEDVIEQPGEGVDVVYAWTTYALEANLEQLILVEGAQARYGVGNDDGNIMLGNSLANTIWGNGGDDVIYGGPGGDSLLGSNGDDALDGGEDADTLVGGPGNDRFVIDTYAGESVVENPGEGIDVVYAMIDYTIGGNIEQLILVEGSAAANGAGDGGDNVIIGNSAANVIYGNGGGDTLLGFAGADVLFGGDGNDILDAGDGNDVFFGGSGADAFKVSSGDDADTVLDLIQAQGDRLLLSSTLAAGFNDLILNHTSIVGGNLVLSFAGGQSVTLLGISSAAELLPTAIDFF